MRVLKLNNAAIMTIDQIVERHRNKRGPVKLMLHEVQEEFGYVPFEAMVKIAEAANVSLADVYGVVTFYTQFTTEPKGKHVINLCLGTACYVKGAQDLLDEVLRITGASVNKTSEDGLFSVDATRCLGACSLAPVVVVDGEVYGNLNDKTVLVNIVDEIKAREAVWFDKLIDKKC